MTVPVPAPVPDPRKALPPRELKVLSRIPAPPPVRKGALSAYVRWCETVDRVVMVDAEAVGKNVLTEAELAEARARRKMHLHVCLACVVASVAFVSAIGMIGIEWVVGSTILSQLAQEYLDLVGGW